MRACIRPVRLVSRRTAQVMHERTRCTSRFPDHDARYGARGRAFCAHDNAYLVAWLVDSLELAGLDSFGTNVEWLRDLLAARDFPMNGFWRNLELVGEAVAERRPLDADQVRRSVALARNGATSR